MSEGEEYPGFSPEHDVPIPYMQRIRNYYQGLGYGAPYRWAHYAEVPFQPLQKPLAECRVALITTAAPYQPGKGDQGPGAPYNAAAKFYSVYSEDAAVDHDLRISHVGIDRVHTSAEDSNTWFPLPELRRCAANGRITARRPTAAIARRSSGTALNCWRAAAPMAPTPPFSSPIDRCATRP
jgi:D-proline reductase (dithiol) PrdB